MERTFHPVGQGAFYSEKIRLNTDHYFNVVYDCGSISAKPALSNCIKNYSEESIDILFISHFDDDHISGVSELSKKCVIKKVIIPYMDTIDKLVSIGSFTGSDIALAKFVLDPRTLLPESYIISVQAAEDPERAGNESIIAVEDLDKSIKSGTSIIINNVLGSCNWVYIPVNIKHNEKRIDFIKELIRQGIITSENDGIDPKRLNRDFIQKIKKAYESVFGIKHMNNTSLLLYSGRNCSPIQRKCNRLYHCDIHTNNLRRCLHTRCCGCLYLGDIHLNDKNSKNILSYYGPYKNCICVIQVPHHGSNTSNNDSFWDHFHNRIGVLSYGIPNRYRHPHKKMMVQLINHGIHTIEVTNDPPSKFRCRTPNHGCRQ